MLKSKPISEDEASSDSSEHLHATTYTSPRCFQDFGLSYKSYQFLQRLALSAQYIRSEPLESILFYLCQVTKIQMLSELEIVWFGIYLARFGWTDCTHSLKEILNYTAFAAKSVLNDNTEDLEQELLKESPSFTIEYRKWFGKYQNLINIGYFELNSKYVELSYVKPESDESTAIDYNLYVVQLLESNNSSKQEEP